MLNSKTIEKENIVADQLNGRFAIVGSIAVISAYPINSQIIPVFI